MWKTIKYSIKGKPLIDVNEQGIFYSYRNRDIKKLKLNREKNPYYCWCDLDESGKLTTYYAHIEVAKAFPEICGVWFDGCEVHHKDGNALNNEASNLIVCTKEQHIEFHRKKNVIKEERRNLVKERIESKKKYVEEALRNKSDYTFHYYCKESRVDEYGYSPIILVVYSKIDHKRMALYTGFKQKPEDFKNGLMPEGFENITL